MAVLDGRLAMPYPFENTGLLFSRIVIAQPGSSARYTLRIRLSIELKLFWALPAMARKKNAGIRINLYFFLLKNVGVAGMFKCWMDEFIK